MDGMSPAELQGFVPLTGSAALLGYLLKVWITERRDRERERAQLISEYRQALADKEAEKMALRAEQRQAMLELVADKDAIIRQLRDRVLEQESEIRAWRKGDGE